MGQMNSWAVAFGVAVAALVGCGNVEETGRDEPTGAIQEITGMAGSGGSGGGIPTCPNFACAVHDPTGEIEGDCCNCNGNVRTYKPRVGLYHWYFCSQ